MITMTATTEILVFKTDIGNPEAGKRLEPFLAALPAVLRWTVDCDDVDCVLRVEVSERLDPKRIIEQVAAAGFSCEELT